MKGHYTGPHTQQGLLVANNPLDLLCIDFLKIDPSKDSEENVLLLTDAFTKLSQSFVTCKQKVLIVAKILVDNGFMSIGFQPTFIVIRAEVLKMTSSSPICTPCITSQVYDHSLQPMWEFYM